MSKMNISMSMQGANETIRNLNMFDMKKKQEAITVVRKYAGQVRKGAKQRVPVSPSTRKKSSGAPGDLKKSIRAKFYYGGLGAMVMPAKPKGSHRAIVEMGTKNRTNSNGANRGRVKSKPFMEPAKKAVEAKYNSDMSKLFVKSTDRI